MENGYFRLVNEGRGFGLALYQPSDGGEEIHIGEIVEYLDGLEIGYDREEIETSLGRAKNLVCHLENDECPSVPETYRLTIEEDRMKATVRFIPASETGERLTYDDFLKDMRSRDISFGFQTGELLDHFQSKGIYCTDLVVALGKGPVAGEDAKIEYMFPTEQHRRPAMKEDGSVDYFHLTTINQCRKGEVLARVIPEKPGIDGHDIFGKAVKAKAPKPAMLKFGRNIVLSEDKRSITSAVDGHVTLVDGKVFVSDVFEVKDVDVSTGNIDYEGSVHVSGNVTENYEVRAGGNILIDGLVEGAKVVAGGNIIIAKGMNGNAKGFLKAGGDVIVRYLENTRVVAGGYVQADAVLHSRVSAGTEVIVEGKKGVIVGGYVQAANRITSKSIGASMGSSTILEVGVNPLLKTQYSRVQKAVEDDTKTVKNAKVILANFKERLSGGKQYSESDLKYMKSVANLVDEKSAELEELRSRLEKLREMLTVQNQAQVVINDEIYAGTTIIIGDVSRTLQSDFHYCKFGREQGEVRMLPM